MNIFDIITLFGGLSLFLYGMRLMGDSLKSGSSGPLKLAMEQVTNNPIKAFLLGVAVTAIIQSSTATIVITSGLVGAGILSLHQALGIIIGANVGTTVTGQIIRLLDVNASDGSWLQLFKPSTLAPVSLIIGIIIIMAFKKKKNAGNIAIGFGILFTGLMNMTAAVSAVTESGMAERLFSGLGNNPILGYLTGAGVAFVLQSSSATIGILQAFSASGLLTFKMIYPVIVGVYLGDCVTTAIVCSIGARAEAKRVGIVNIMYNLCKMVLVLGVVAILHKVGLLNSIWERVANSSLIANSNTVFNIACAIIMLPFISMLEKLANKVVKDKPAPESKYKEQIEGLSPAFFNAPALALGSCYNALMAMFMASRENIKKAVGLLSKYDEKIADEISAEEENIDQLTDHVSRYIVELLPKFKEPAHVSIMDQYYKVASDFERLGDVAVNIAKIARELNENGSNFSLPAQGEIVVLHELDEQILDEAQKAFEKRDVDAAYRIEPLEEVAEDVVAKLKLNHLNRISEGKCNMMVEPAFMNLLSDMKRIADICSNIGAATIIRVNPEIADKEHDFYSDLHSGRDENFNKEYNKAYAEVFSKLEEKSSANESEDVVE